jgi:4-alpha-glucanotransferase
MDRVLPAALARAVEFYGIELVYTDTWGDEHSASEPAIRSVLGALGVPMGCDEEVDHFLDERILEQWRRGLDPTLVVYTGTDSIGLRIPASRSGETVKLELLWENGDKEHHWYWLPELRNLEKAHVQGTDYIRKRLPLPKDLRLGYHQASVYWVKEPELEVLAQSYFIVCPPSARKFEGRTAGVALSLYGLRSSRNWGCGDFTDLLGAIEAFAAAGASFVALNPLHAIANRQPYNTSPYLPESTFFRNFLYLDVERAPGFSNNAAYRERAEALRRGEFVEYERVAELKLEALAGAFERFLETGSDPAFDAFEQSEGKQLHGYAVYCALNEEMHRRDANVWIWTQWPAHLRDPQSQAVKDFAQQFAERVRFFKFLQWQVDVQLARAQERAIEHGMKIGVYHDLALATDRFGADLWLNRPFFAGRAGVGAPPDALGPGGQDWAFPPPNKEAHRADGYRHFAQSIRKNARHGGALRIDHVMRFFRLFWIPEGMTAREGVYVRDYVEDLLGILGLESHRQGFYVVGEDLGTVAPEVRARLAQAEILGYRLLWFEQNTDGDFLSPQEYEKNAAVSTTTHDLPTLSGFFAGRDIEARKDAGLVEGGDYLKQKLDRERDIVHLNIALEAAGFPDDGLGFVLATPSTFAIVNQEDLTGEEYQQNLPASTWQYPNWRRKMTVAVEDFGTLADRLREAIQRSGRLTG